jgi:hypothetical protein
MSTAEQRVMLAAPIAAALVATEWQRDGRYAPGKNKEIAEQAVAIARTLEKAAARSIKTWRGGGRLEGLRAEVTD